MRPTRQETIHTRLIQTRMDQLGARHSSADSAKAGKNVYYSASYQVWIVAEAAGSVTRLLFYDQCPCSGAK